MKLPNSGSIAFKTGMRAEYNVRKKGARLRRYEPCYDRVGRLTTVGRNAGQLLPDLQNVPNVPATGSQEAGYR